MFEELSDERLHNKVLQYITIDRIILCFHIVNGEYSRK